MSTPIRPSARRHNLDFDKEREWSAIDESVRLVIEAAAIGDCRWPLVFMGKAGSGKSCASLCMWDKYGGHWHSFAALCAKLNEADFDRLHDHLGYRIFPRDIWNDWRNTNLGIIDDVGTRSKITDHQYETLKLALDAREEKPTVITTNLDIQALGRLFDDRIASRIAGGTIVEFSGDRRIERRTND